MTIRRTDDLISEVAHGETVSRMIGFGGNNAWGWCISGTNEPVHGTALKCAIKRGALAVVGTDITGEPMSYGAPR